MYLKKTNIIIFLLLLFLSITLHSQNHELDSLLQDTKNVSEKEKSKHYEKIADQYLSIPNYTSAIIFYKKSLDLSISKREKLYLKKKIGLLYFYISNFDKAFEYYNNALVIAEKLNDTTSMSGILNNIGIIYQKTNNYEKSIAYLNKSLKYKILLKDSTGIANTYNNLGILFYSKDKDKSLEFYKKALEIRIQIHDTVGMGVSYNNIGYMFFEQNQFQDALKYYEASLMIDSITNNKNGTAISLNNIAEIFLLSKNYSKAIEYNQKSLEISKNIKDFLQISTSYLSLSNCYEKKKDYKNAYVYYKLYKEVNDSIFNEKSQNKIAELETKYQLTKKEQIIQLLEKENRLKQIKQNYFVVGIIFFIFIILVVVYVQMLRNKSNKQKLIILKEEKQIQRLLNDKQNLENRKLKDELELKKRELTSKALMLVKNNETIINILKDVNEIKQNTNSETKNIINNFIKKHKVSTKNFNWKEFKMIFEEVHQDFYSNLTKIYTNLTPTEIKLCAFLRLNLTSKEIATITFKSIYTIKSSRRRLRKKLNIPLEQNLVSYMLKF